MKAQTWYSTHGDATNNEITRGSLNQMIMKFSIGSMITRCGSLTPIFRSASKAGALTTLHKSMENPTHRKNATPSPAIALIRRERSSFRWSRNDMRSMPSSSGSSSSGGGGGGG